MMVKEFRVRYELDTAMGNKVIHGVVCSPQKLTHYLSEVARVGYRLVGIDRRFKNDCERVPVNEGWEILKEYC